MRNYYNYMFIFVVIFLFCILSISINESFRGRGGGRVGGIGPGPGLYSGYGYGHIGPRQIYRPGMRVNYPNYRRQFYSYGNYYGGYPLRRNLIVAPVAVPVQTVHEDPWYVRLFTGPQCKTGCTSIGNGEWGCQYLGNGIDECQFANDCTGCGGSWWVWNW